ncbi:AhpA/YtjB family protein [Moellerella wisconsensis]|uniref:AhpA/YtjB family protein n=1 Tax=Moellerella wisconsensis TaxID=158849 RepID=UPI001F4EF4A3|nr:AhpA/YtjB family protein [Moellerella wisconsensis]UNH26855.1 AhpA/YtjB family protein [Moellerella wisconsensis]
MMIQTKLSFRLHKSVIIITCIALIALLMQSVSYISRIHYQARIDQFKQLSHTLAEQVAFSLSDYIVDGSKDFNREMIIANLDKMTSNSRILDASVYLNNGTLIAESGENVPIKSRLAIDNANNQHPFQYQLVVPIPDAVHPKGYMRMTIDTQQLSTEAQQADNTTNILRMFMLLTFATGFILANTLFRLKHKKGQKLPFPLMEDEDLTENYLESQANSEQKTAMKKIKKEPKKSRAHRDKYHHSAKHKPKKPNTKKVE